MGRAILLSLLLFSASFTFAKKRARELGIPLEGIPGKWNAITDVAGVEVGFVTLISGKGALKVGKGPIRTGVTAILPRGKKDFGSYYAAWDVLNGNGDLTGTQWIDDSGQLDVPILFTNTYSVGTVRDGLIKWFSQTGRADSVVSLPVVGETWDGYLNDVAGLHVRPEHTLEAIAKASNSKLEEGNVGGGTGMICFEFKCGTGTSSRKISLKGKEYTLGTLVQANFGLRRHLKILGVPIGLQMRENLVWSKETGSILVAIATDAPLLPHQLKRIAKRAGLGIGRLGGVGANSSGDLFIAFSTANKGQSVPQKDGTYSVTALANDDIDPFFEATIQSVEESILNSMVAADPMDGIESRQVSAISIPKLQEILKEHSQLQLSE